MHNVQYINTTIKPIEVYSCKVTKGIESSSYRIDLK